MDVRKMTEHGSRKRSTVITKLSAIRPSLCFAVKSVHRSRESTPQELNVLQSSHTLALSLLSSIKGRLKFG